MKHIYLILIAFFTLLSCSDDDSNSDEETINLNTYTLELNASEELQEIKIHLKMNSEDISETFSVTNSSSISVDFTKEDASIISAEIIDSSPTPIFRYKIFAKCNGEVVGLLVDKGEIGKQMSEFISSLRGFNCDNF